MRLSTLLASVIAGAVLFGAAAEAANPPERRIALIIGNARYTEAPLRNASNDARAMAAVLRDRDFEVILREDATRHQIEASILDFGERLTEGATGLFFYAGHGLQVNGRNYIVPIDARLSSEQRVKLEAVDVEAVLDQMQGARSKVNVVILDACRNNPFERRFRSASGGLAQINAPEGTLIAYSTAPGKVAADGEGANGLYTRELLRALTTPGLKVEDVFKQVRVNVARASNGAQTPWEASSLVGDFYFVPAAPPTAQARPNSIEVEFWNSIRNSTEPSELRAYLNRYPNGEFVDLARLRLEAAEKARLVAGTSAPQQASLTSPSAPGLGDALDGKYHAVISGSTWGALDISAWIEIIGTRITGTGFHGGPCQISGRINRDGSVVAPLRIECDRVNDQKGQAAPSISLFLEGRFIQSPDNQEIIGEMTFRSNERRTGTVQWRRVAGP